MKNLIPSPVLTVWDRKAKISILSTYHTLHNYTVIHRYWSEFKDSLLEFMKFSSLSTLNRLIQEGET
jgi:hypothetical protein